MGIGVLGSGFRVQGSGFWAGEAAKRHFAHQGLAFLNRRILLVQQLESVTLNSRCAFDLHIRCSGAAYESIPFYQGSIVSTVDT